MHGQPQAVVDPAITHRDVRLAILRTRLVRFACGRVPADAAEDLAQDVLLLLAAKYPDKTAPEDLLPLAFRILRFKLMAYRRKRVRRGEDAQVDPSVIDVVTPGHDQSLDADWTLRRRELAERLVRALRQLGPRCRELFRLKIEGLDFRAIQVAMRAASINTVYTWDARCRRRLHLLLGDVVQ
jgi:RNA polymerase sigma-70 factor (ECF subfamily)